MEEMHLGQLQINTIGYSFADACRGQGKFLTVRADRNP